MATEPWAGASSDVYLLDCVLWVLGHTGEQSSRQKFKPDLRGAQSKRSPDMKARPLDSNSWVPPEWSKLERSTIPSADKDVEHKLSYTAGGNVSW